MASKRPTVITSGQTEQIQAADVIDTAAMGTGTANSTTYLRGDNSWASVSAGDPDLTPTSSRTIATGKTVVQGGYYEITGVLNLTMQGTSKLTIL